MEFGVLGPVEVQVDGRPAHAGHARQRAVLAVLLLDLDRVVPLEVLIDRVWGDEPPRSVRNVVYGYVGRLKMLIAAAQDREVTLSRQPGGYQLHANPDQVDERRFHSLIAGASTAAGDDERAGVLLGEALALWRGTALAGLDSPWLNGQRARLELERAAADGDLRDIRLRRGEHAALAGELTAQAAVSPADERLIGQLMLALYRLGRQAEALSWFEHTRQHLASELGTDPGPDLQALHVQILRTDPALNLSPTVTSLRRIALAPCALPTDVPAFTSRAAELANVDRNLAGPAAAAGQVAETGAGKGHMPAAVIPDHGRSQRSSPGAEPGSELRELHQRFPNTDPGLAVENSTQVLSGRNALRWADGTAPPLASDRRVIDSPSFRLSANSAQQRLDKASQELAIAVVRQWTAEATMRSLGRPEPIQLSWSITHRTAPTALPADDPKARELVPPNAHGDLTDLITGFRQLPRRQLVVLGEPGAGKTALAVLLTLSLLTNPEPGEPVPVLLPLSSWDPGNEHLYTWLARKLTEEYSGLGNVASYGPHAAQRLVADDRVMPVLDGLDEMPSELQAAAIDAIDMATAGGRPLVVTCRSTEYEQAVLRGGAIFASATVVRMQPVDIEDAARFLIAREHPGRSRWLPVVEHLRRHPQGQVAQVMSTPLMVDLARTAYSGTANDPAELCDAVIFPDSASIEEHLLGAFVPAAYPRQIPRLSTAAGIFPAGLLRYEPGQARRWLTFLAQHLHGMRTRDFAWWRLAEAIPRPVRGLIFALPPALVFAVAGEIAGGARVGIVYGVAFGVAGFVAHSLGRRPIPLRVELRFRGTATRFLERVAIGLAIGVVLGLAWSLSRGLVLMLGLVFGLALGVHVWLDTPADASRVSSPLTVLKQERTAALSYTLTFALSIGTFYAVADAFTKRIVFIPVLGGSFDLALALACGMAAVPLARFAFGRVGAVAYGLAAAVVGGLVFPPARTLFGGLMAGTVFGIAIGLTIFLSRAWGSFILTRAWLSMRGKTPLRLMRFLADTHRRAVLRQAGAIYQFRHAHLQDNLANQRDSAGAGAGRRLDMS